MAAALRLVAPESDPRTAARAAGLRYISDQVPGIGRERAGGSFVYLLPDGSRLRDHDEFLRIKELAIPPAWTRVWISPAEDGHIQATGRDARGRKQYRYHARWREIRDGAKYHNTRAFGATLPVLRERAAHDLSLPGLPQEKVIAAVVTLLESTLARIGNEEYARANGHYGLTTLRDRHATFDAGGVSFRFVGKVGRKHEVSVADPRLARIVRRCQELPGQLLFQYEDDAGAPRPVTSTDVNEYLRAATGLPFTAKDVRTWSGTRFAAVELASLDPAPAKAARNRQVTAAITRVSERLGNTVAVCRRCYVHPAVVDSFLGGKLAREYVPRAPRDEAEAMYLPAEERALIGLLDARVG